MSTDPTLKPDRTADWYMDVVWPLLPVPGEFDGMDACDQFRWRSVVRLAIEYVLCGERGVPPGSKTPHCPKGDGPCIRGCKGWECRDGWPDDPTLKPDIAALKKRLAEDPGFAAQVTGDRPLRRNVDGVCTRSTCEWVAVAPVGTIWMECPACSLERGRYLGAVNVGGDHWHCRCGNDLFRATPAGMYCPNCGEWQHGF